MMRTGITVHIYKAQAIGDQVIRDVDLKICIPIPDTSNDLTAAALQFEKQAEELHEALYGSLPGGTYDRLLVRMLAQKASLFRVTYPGEV